MNTKLVLFSFIIILAIHYFVLTYFFKEKTSVPSIINSKIISIKLNQIKKQEIKKTKVKSKPKVKSKLKPKAKVKPKSKPKKIQKKVLKKLAKKKIIKKIIKQKLIVKEKIKEVIASKKDVKKIEKEQKRSKELQVLVKKQSQKSKAKYYSKLKQYISTYKSYPSISRRLEEEGISKVSFRVLRNGTFTNIKLLTSSGESRLDEASLEAIEEAKKFEAFDKKIKEDYLDFKVQLEYKLE